MNIVIFLTNDQNFKPIRNNQNMLDIVLSIYQRTKVIDYFIIACSNLNETSIKHLQNNQIYLFTSNHDRDIALKEAITFLNNKINIADNDNIIIHDVNYANVEDRIIHNLLNWSKKYNFVNTLFPIENTFKIINNNNSQFLIKNKEEVYTLQSPQLIKYDVFCSLYLDEKNKVKIKMMNALGSKSNYDLSNEDNLIIFKAKANQVF